MARYQNYQCPDCGGKFRHMHVLSDDPPPERCPLCGAWVSEDTPMEPTFIPTAPRIRESPFAKSEDQVYRAMETSSEQRADEAASMLGVPKADVSNIKITNMKTATEMREGDIAAILPAAESVAAQRLSVGPSHPGFQQVAGGIANYAPGVGPARAAVETHAGITGHQGWIDGTPPTQNSQHQARAQAMARAGEMGRYNEK